MPMKDHKKNPYHKIGSLPGSLIYIGKKPKIKMVISVYEYNKSKFKEYKIDKISDLKKLDDKSTIRWISVRGLNDPKKIKEFGKKFDLHNLILEDIMDTKHRPKIEISDKHIFLILKSLGSNCAIQNYTIDQISLIIKDNLVISFQENNCDFIRTITERLKEKRGLIRQEKNDYLAYTIIDLVIDSYFCLIEQIENKVEQLELDVLNNPQPKTIQKINGLKKEIVTINKMIWPLKDIINNLIKLDSKFVLDSTKKYLSDVYDHNVYLIDSIDTFKGIAKGLADMYFSSLNNKMNEIIKVFTIMTSIFIPLTFITGIYGMNFRHMPELSSEYGYYAALITMLIMAFVMIIFFRRKKWL